MLAAAPLFAADAAIETDVPAGQSRSIRIRNLPAGAQLAVRIVANARLLVAVVSARQLKEPRAGEKPLFRAVVQDKLSLRVSIAEAGDYLVVLSNRGGKQAVTVQAEVRVARSPKRAPPPSRPPPGQKA